MEFRTYLKNNLSAHGAVLRNGSKCSHTTRMLRFFTVSRLALNPNLIFETGSINEEDKKRKSNMIIVKNPR